MDKVTNRNGLLILVILVLICIPDGLTGNPKKKKKRKTTRPPISALASASQTHGNQVPTTRSCSKTLAYLGGITLGIVVGTGYWLWTNSNRVEKNQQEDQEEQAHQKVPLLGTQLLPEAELQHLSTLSIEDMAKYIRNKYGVLVVFVEKDGSNTDDPRNAGLSEKELTRFSQLVNKTVKDTRKRFEKVEEEKLRFMGRYFPSKQDGGTIERPRADQPLILQARDSDPTNLLHEFMHHIQQTKEASRAKVDNSEMPTLTLFKDMENIYEGYERAKSSLTNKSNENLLEDEQLKIVQAYASARVRYDLSRLMAEKYLSSKEFEVISLQLKYRDELSMSRRQIVESLAYIERLKKNIRVIVNEISDELVYQDFSGPLTHLRSPEMTANMAKLSRLSKDCKNLCSRVDSYITSPAFSDYIEVHP